MTLFLLILKIIGIILLSIICLVLFLLLLVLFVPVRYRIKARKGVEKDDFDAVIGISWLLHIITIKVRLNAHQITSPIVDLYIACIKKNIIPGKEKEKETAADKPTVSEISSNSSSLYKLEGFDDSDSISTNINNEIDDIDKVSVNNIDNDVISGSVYSKNETINNAITEKKFSESEDDNSDTSCEEGHNKKSFSDLIKDFIDFLVQSYEKIKNLLYNLINNTENTVEKIKKEYRFYDKFINDEKNKSAVKTGLNELLRIIKSIKPRRVKGELTFGFEDPYTTGQVLAVLSMLYPLLYKRMKIKPVFDENIIHGKIDIRGHITVFIIVFAAARVYFNKNIKRMMAIYKRHKEKAGKQL